MLSLINMFLSQPLHDWTVAKVLLLPCRSAGPSWHRPRAFSAPNAADLASLKAHAPPELNRASEPISSPDEPVHAVASDPDVALPADSGKPGRYYTLTPLLLQGGGYSHVWPRPQCSMHILLGPSLARLPGPSSECVTARMHEEGALLTAITLCANFISACTPSPAALACEIFTSCHQDLRKQCMSDAYTCSVMHANGAYIVCEIVLARPVLMPDNARNNTIKPAYARHAFIIKRKLAAMGMCVS